MSENFRLSVSALEQILAAYAREHRMRYVPDPHGDACGTPVYRLYWWDGGHWWQGGRHNQIRVWLHRWHEPIREVSLEQRNWAEGENYQHGVDLPGAWFWLLAPVLAPLGCVTRFFGRMRDGQFAILRAEADVETVRRVLDEARECLAEDWVATGPKFDRFPWSEV